MLPWLLLGPISGPLALGLNRAIRDRRPGMALAYAVAIAEAILGLPWLAAALLHLVRR